MTFLQKWIIFAYFVKRGPKFFSHDSLSGKDEKIHYVQKVQKWTIFWSFWLQKVWKNHIVKIEYFILFWVENVKNGPKFGCHDSMSGNNEKINYLEKVLKWTIFLSFWREKSQKLTSVQKWIIFAYFEWKMWIIVLSSFPMIPRVERTKNTLCPKRAKMDHFFIILTAKKSKNDCSAKVDNFCLFC